MTDFFKSFAVRLVASAIVSAVVSAFMIWFVVDQTLDEFGRSVQRQHDALVRLEQVVDEQREAFHALDKQFIRLDAKVGGVENKIEDGFANLINKTSIQKQHSIFAQNQGQSLSLTDEEAKDLEKALQNEQIRKILKKAISELGG